MPIYIEVINAIRRKRPINTKKERAVFWPAQRPSDKHVFYLRLTIRITRP